MTAAKKKKVEGALKITLIHRPGRETHRRIVWSMGLRRMGKTCILPDRPEIRGMCAKVPHLLRVEEVKNEPAE